MLQYLAKFTVNSCEFSCNGYARVRGWKGRRPNPSCMYITTCQYTWPNLLTTHELWRTTEVGAHTSRPKWGRQVFERRECHLELEAVTAANAHRDISCSDSAPRPGGGCEGQFVRILCPATPARDHEFVWPNVAPPTVLTRAERLLSSAVVVKPERGGHTMPLAQPAIASM